MRPDGRGRPGFVIASTRTSTMSFTTFANATASPRLDLLSAAQAAKPTTATSHTDVKRYATTTAVAAGTATPVDASVASIAGSAIPVPAGAPGTCRATCTARYARPRVRAPNCT